MEGMHLNAISGLIYQVRTFNSSYQNLFKKVAVINFYLLILIIIICNEEASDGLTDW